MTIALATAPARDAMHHVFINEQQLHLTTVFLQSNSISLEQSGSIDTGVRTRGAARRACLSGRGGLGAGCLGGSA